MMNQIPNPRAEIDDLSRVVSDALKQAKSGLTVSLSDLDAVLCCNFNDLASDGAMTRRDNAPRITGLRTVALNSNGNVSRVS